MKFLNFNFFIKTAALLFILLILFQAYKFFLAPNVYCGSDSFKYIEIATNSKFENVKETLYTNGIIINRFSFETVAKLLGYADKVKPGKYKITNDFNNFQIIALLKSGKQTPVNVIFNNIRTPQQLAQRISYQIEPDSISLITLFNDSNYLKKFNIIPIELFTITIPNSYEMYWTSTAESFLDKMKSESDKFWKSNNRDERCKEIGFTKNQLVTLASIVEKETNSKMEKPIIAGVYINRLKKGYFLQADPTVVFAHNNFNIKRVLAHHLEINSPYNTYKNKGLPPGPICLPSIESIDAVLNFREHNYLFFCASEDLNGLHMFSSSYELHLINARKYQKALNERNIF